MSCCYYALFHCLARECANSVIGNVPAKRSNKAYKQVYRALEHGHAGKSCESGSISVFPVEIQEFASTFAQLQKKREYADYDPFAVVAKSDAVAHITMAKAALAKFASASTKDRRAFCAWVLFRVRK